MAFEVPVVVVLLVLLGFVDIAALRKGRPYVIVGAFVIGMVLTPPDMFSQTLLAVPICLLFEAGLLVAGLLGRRTARSRRGLGSRLTDLRRCGVEIWLHFCFPVATLC